jgi:hypothetical protein
LPVSSEREPINGATIRRFINLFASEHCPINILAA